MYEIVKFEVDDPKHKQDYEKNFKYVKENFNEKIKKIIKSLGKVPGVKDIITLYYCALDSKTPFSVKAIAIAGLVYVISPLDIVPDAIPIVGLSDDIAVVIGVLKYLEEYVSDEHRQKAEEFMKD